MRIALLALLFIAGLTGCNGKPQEASPETTERAVTDPVISELVVPGAGEELVLAPWLVMP